MEEGHHFLTDILTTGALLLGAALVERLLDHAEISFALES